MPVIDIYGSVDGTDLRTVANQVDSIVARAEKHLPRGSQIVVRGQILTMRSSTIGLLGGLLFAIGLVYLLIVVNFQSWLDPFIIIAALPAALTGIVWFLFLTHTHYQRAGFDRLHHVHGRGHGEQHPGGQLCARGDGAGAECNRGGAGCRFHPLSSGADDGAGHDYRHGADGAGLGQSGEQNAPLGRSVIGGLMFATVATLFFVPVFFSIGARKIEASRRRETKVLNPCLRSDDWALRF